MALVFYYKDMLEKVTMQRTQQFSAFVCYRKNHLNATHAQLLEKLRPIALAETWSTRLIYQEKFEFWHREFFIIQKTFNGELQKSPMSKFY